MKINKILQFIREKRDILKGAPLAIPLTRGVAAGIILAVLCAVGWAYYLGLMVGRGQNPQMELSGITGMKPNLESSGQESEPEMDGPEVALIRPRDSEALEAGPSGRVPAQFERPQGEQLAAWPEALTKNLEESKPVQKRQPPPAKPAQPRPVAAPAVNSGPQYNFIYQLAAFHSAKDAENLKTRLIKSGIRAATQKSGKVTLVTCSMRGREGDALAFRKKLANFNLGQPMLLSKKPVTGVGGGKK